MKQKQKLFNIKKGKLPCFYNNFCFFLKVFKSYFTCFHDDRFCTKVTINGQSIMYNYTLWKSNLKEKK